MESASANCPSCAEPLRGKFCYACGEEALHERDLSLRRFFGRALQELADFEHSKTFRSFAALLFKPGFLTREYLAGRRNLYLSPLKVCLLVFALYLFTYSVYKPAAIFNLERMLQSDQTGKLTKFLVERQAAKIGVEPATFIERVNEQWHRYMSLLQITSVLFFAVMLQIIYLRSRRYFVEHLVFAMHFLSFAFLFSVLIWPLNLLTGMEMSRARLLVFVPGLLTTLVYLFLALRRVYAEERATTAMKTVVLSLGYHVILTGIIIMTMMLAYAHVLIAGR